MFNPEQDRELRNTMVGRGFSRPVEGRDYYVVQPRLQPDPWRPIVWGAIYLVSLAALVGVAFLLKDVASAAIALGDWLGITAR